MNTRAKVITDKVNLLWENGAISRLYFLASFVADDFDMLAINFSNRFGSPLFTSSEELDCSAVTEGTDCRCAMVGEFNADLGITENVEDDSVRTMLDWWGTMELKASVRFPNVTTDRIPTEHEARL